MLAKNFQRAIDVILDSIVSFTDYFIIRQHITLSEATLFILAAARAIWFTIFGVNIAGTQMLTHEAWIPAFWVITLVHVASFFISVKMRIIVMMAHGFVWCFLGILMLMSSSTSPTVINFFTFSILGVFIAVRLMREIEIDAAAEGE